MEYYGKAREEGLTPDTIRSGWLATGIVPWDPNRIYRAIAPSAIPGSPEPCQISQDNDNEVFSTPRKPGDFYNALQSNSQDTSLPQRARSAMSKARKAVDEGAVIIAEQEALIKC